MFKHAISVPGLTMKYLFKSIGKDVDFYRCGEAHKDLYHKIKDQIVGGPSIIFHRYHEKGVTKIREVEFSEEAKVCESIVGFDANALYLWSLAQSMPTGRFIRRRVENQFRPEHAAGGTTDRHSKVSLQWLAWEQFQDPVMRIRHAGNGREVRIGPARCPVDGFDPETKRVFQFHGCFYHGHDCRHNPDRKKENPFRPGMNMDDLLKETRDRSEYLQKLGYNVTEMWECEWREKCKNDPDVKAFLHSHFPPITEQTPDCMTEAEVLAAIQSDEFFGLVEVDIMVPTHLREHFAEMPPLFKNTTISRSHIGDVMQQFAEEHNIMSQPRRSLIGSFFGKNMLMITPLLKWYIAHGLEISKVHEVIQYTPLSCFEEFASRVSAARRDGDRDPDCSLVAETMKLLGNCGYGKTVTNQMRFCDVTYANTDQASHLINSSRFRKLNQIDEGVYEVESAKKKQSLDLPHHIGFFVYNYAKLRMLQFYYDFMDVFIERRDFQYIEMDTDSAYIALSVSNLEDAVKPELKEQFFHSYAQWFPSLACDQHMEEFVQAKSAGQVWELQPCCQERKQFDKRTPGLFKEEWRGDGMIALCSKTYFGWGEGCSNKVSCKGLQKRHNALTKEKFLTVLTSQNSGHGTNRGFRSLNNQVFTYTQVRDALTYFYPKRKVMADRVSTAPLDI